MHGMNIILSGGATELETIVKTAVDAVRRAETLLVNEGESLGSITMRAYGANTRALRDKISQANANLTGSVVIPK